MPLLGQGAYGVPTDYSAVGDSAWRMAQAMSGAVGGIGNAIEGQIEKRKQYKDDLKTGKELAKAMKVIYPELSTAIDPYIAQMDNEETPLSQRASLGNNAATLINAYIRKADSDRAYNLDLAANNRAERGMALDEQRGAVDVQRITNAMKQEEHDAANKADLTQFMARPLLDQALSATALANKSGQRPLIDVAAIKRAYNKSPEQQMQIASAALAGLPKQDPVELRNIKFTRDGQAMEGLGYFDPKTGKATIVPVQQAYGDGSGGQSINDSGVFRAPSTNYSLGKDAGGPDEMQDYWTNRGYSSTGKNLAPGVVAVNPKAYKHGTVFQDADTGEVFIAADSHGNKDPNVIDVYQPPREYQRSNKPRNMRVIGFEENVGKTPQEIAQQRAKWSQAAAQGGIQAGAPTGPSKTPTEEALDRARLEKVQGDVQMREIAQEKEKATRSAALENAQGAAKLIDTLEKHPGFSGAVGISATPGFIPGTDRKGAEAIIEQIKGQAFLNSIQQLRGMGALSDAEGAKLQQASARLNTSQSEKDFKAALAEYKQVIESGIIRLKKTMGDESAANPAADFNNRFALKRGQ